MFAQQVVCGGYSYAKTQSLMRNAVLNAHALWVTIVVGKVRACAHLWSPESVPAIVLARDL